jgi:hypothetical protein
MRGLRICVKTVTHLVIGDFCKHSLEVNFLIDVQCRAIGAVCRPAFIFSFEWTRIKPQIAARLDGQRTASTEKLVYYHVQSNTNLFPPASRLNTDKWQELIPFPDSRESFTFKLPAEQNNFNASDHAEVRTCAIVHRSKGSYIGRLGRIAQLNKPCPRKHGLTSPWLRRAIPAGLLIFVEIPER